MASQFIVRRIQPAPLALALISLGFVLTVLMRALVISPGSSVPPADIIVVEMPTISPEVLPEPQVPEPLVVGTPERLRPVPSARPPAGRVFTILDSALLGGVGIDPTAVLVARLRLHLENVRGEAGTAVVGEVSLVLTVARDGRLVEARIDQPGAAELDAAALELARGAAPYPPMPSDAPDHVQLIVPISFPRLDEAGLAALRLTANAQVTSVR